MRQRQSFLQEGRFAFQSSLAETEAERVNPWLLLERSEADGAIPVIADANSMTYVLHKKLGDEIVLPRGDGEIRLRLVAALRDSIFQGELLMAEESFLKLFPEQDGFRVLLVRAGEAPMADLESTLEDGFADLGAQRHRDRGTAGSVPSRREHVPLDVPDAGWAWPSSRHLRAGDSALA